MPAYEFICGLHLYSYAGRLHPRRVAVFPLTGNHPTPECLGFTRFSRRRHILVTSVRLRCPSGVTPTPGAVRRRRFPLQSRLPGQRLPSPSILHVLAIAGANPPRLSFTVQTVRLAWFARATERNRRRVGRTNCDPRNPKIYIAPIRPRAVRPGG